jgi:hypothetical protein
MWRNTMLAVAAVVVLSACNSGGELAIESNSSKRIKGSPFVTVNQGGKAMIKDASGNYGFVSVQAVAAKQIKSSADGSRAVLSKASAYNGNNGNN